MMTGPATLLLVHGAWMGPWQWDFLTPELERRSVSFALATLPSCGTDPTRLGDLADDATSIEQAVAAIDGDVVVVAHSYAGIPTSQAKLGPNVRRVVYLGAFMPDDGRSLVSYLPPNTFPPFVNLREDGCLSLVTNLIPAHLCNECSAERIDWLTQRVVSQTASVAMSPVGRASWHDRPSIYLVLANDRAIPTELQRVFATQASTAGELNTDHMPMLSNPALPADTLAEILAGERAAAIAN